MRQALVSILGTTKQNTQKDSDEQRITQDLMPLGKIAKL
jgi:hypothetical protein